MGSQDVMPAPFEWDEEKDRANRAKHGIGFEEATGIFTSQILTAPDTRQDYGGRALDQLWITRAAGGPRRGTYPPPRAHQADFCPQGQRQGKAGVL